MAALATVPMRGALLLTLTLLLAGCASDPDGPGGPAPGADPSAPATLPFDPMPEGDGHDHSDATAHQFLWNYELTATDPLLATPANAAGLHVLDRAGDLLFGASYGTGAVPGALTIWDIADPAHPARLGQLTIPGTMGGDRSLGVTPDGAFAVLGMEPLDCAGHVNPLAAAAQAVLVDTRDPGNPVVADVLTVAGGLQSSDVADRTNGIHSVEVHRIDGDDYAYLWGEGFRIVADPSPHLEPAADIIAGHDAYIRATPWNATWVLSANGDTFSVQDLTDPTAPVTIGEWSHPEAGRTDSTYYIHTADVAFLADGRVLVVVTSEDWADHLSPLWVLDGTPLRNHTGGEPLVLKETAQWTNPGNHSALGMHFSLHNPRVHDGHLLSIASYHGGIWQLDLQHALDGQSPVPIAVATVATVAGPVRNPQEDAVVTSPALCNLGEPSPVSFMPSLEVYDVEVGDNGILYSADHTGGLQVFAPTASHPVFGDA